MTLKELSQLYYLNREIEKDEQRLTELEAIATGTTQNVTGMPHGSSVGDKVGKGATDIIYLKGIIELNKKKCWYELTRLTEYINTIPDSLTRQIFEYRFINGLSWRQVAMSIGGGNTEDGVRQICHRYIACHECHGT